jgi:hypothetical protein
VKEMLPLNLVLDLAKIWTENQSLKKLREYASDPRPDIQFDMPIVGAKVDIWVRDVDQPPTTAPKARRGAKIVVADVPFWLYYQVTKRQK